MKYILIAALLSGCVASEPAPQFMLVKPGATPSQREADRGYCEAQAVSATRDIERIMIIIGGCMRGQGWTLVER